MNPRRLIGFTAIVVLTSAIASAQTPPPAGAPGGTPAARPAPPPMTNLQVFPKDTPRQQVVATMQTFTQALGVRCQYCHVDEPGGREDMASDEKAPKKTARAMMLMTREINEKIPAATGKSAEDATRVACVTCHRGVAIPKQLADILAETSASKGAVAAVAQYKELRSRYYGAMAYDFSEGGLIAAATRPGTKPDEAIVWLQLNLEYYPKSVRTYLAMAQIHQRANDKDAALKDLEQAVSLDPNNNQAKQALQRLKGQ
jgi:hypothetical protein